MQYRLTWETRPTRKIVTGDLNRLLAACKQLPAPASVPNFKDTNDAARGKSPSGLYVAQTLDTVRPGKVGK